MTPFEEQCACHNLERIATALELQNEVLNRQADIAFVRLNAGDQQKVEAWDKRRHEALARVRGLAHPVAPQN